MRASHADKNAGDGQFSPKREVLQASLESQPSKEDMIWALAKVSPETKALLREALDDAERIGDNRDVDDACGGGDTGRLLSFQLCSNSGEPASSQQQDSVMKRIEVVSNILEEALDLHLQLVVLDWTAVMESLAVIKGSPRDTIEQCFAREEELQKIEPQVSKLRCDVRSMLKQIRIPLHRIARIVPPHSTNRGTYVTPN